jgi:hypothetical protein
VADLAREVQVSKTTVYAWKRKFGEICLAEKGSISISSENEELNPPRGWYRVSAIDSLQNIGRLLIDTRAALKLAEAALPLIESNVNFQELHEGMLRELEHRISISLEELKSGAAVLCQLSGLEGYFS